MHYDQILAHASALSLDDRRRLVAALQAQLAEAAVEAPPRPLASGPLELGEPAEGHGAPALLCGGLDPDSGRPLLTVRRPALGDLVGQAAVLGESRGTYEARNQLGQLHWGLIDGISYDDLAEAGWALVVSSQEDARILGALAPLIQRRCAQQGLQAPDLEIRAGETCGAWLARQTPNADRPMDAALGDRRVPVLLYHPGESCGAWLGRHGLFAQAVDPRRGVPFYLLLAGLPGPAHPGDQRAIPFVFQYDLDLFWGVGRLCFHDEAGQHRLADYRAYAERLVAYEQGAAAPTARRVAWFGPRNPLDEATDQSATELIPPLAHGQAGQPGVAARYGFGQTVLLGRQATRAALLEQLGRHPALLFSATHGLGFPADDPRQMPRQGALVCADWDGLGAVRREHVLAADDIGPHLDVRGLVHVCFACYGAGCPEEESFVYQPGAPARRIAPRALIGQLPQRLLAQGALAVIGHVDKVWSYSFRARGEASPGAPAPLLTAQVQGFEDLVGRILSGKRMGHATDQFNSHQGALAVDLLERQRRYERVRADYPDLGLDELTKVWKMFQNARCYLLLGDPAARLPPGLLALPGSG